MFANFWKRFIISLDSEITSFLGAVDVPAAFEAVRAELNEVNLLNSKLLYVNRIFKANQLDEGQKLRVVETLDKAGTVKEAKLIYETIKDTFTISKDSKQTYQLRKDLFRLKDQFSSCLL